MRQGPREEILREVRRVEAALAAPAAEAGKVNQTHGCHGRTRSVDGWRPGGRLSMRFSPPVCGAGGVRRWGAALGLVPTLRVLGGGPPESVRLAWDASHGAFCVGLDALSAFFLLPVLGLSALAAVYGGNYLLAYRGKKSLGSSWFFFNLFVAGMVMVVIARTALLFLVAWEVMSLSAYFLVTFEHEKAEVRRAGWIYLVATHLGVAFLFATFRAAGPPRGQPGVRRLSQRCRP